MSQRCGLRDESGEVCTPFVFLEVSLQGKRVASGKEFSPEEVEANFLEWRLNLHSYE